MKKIIALIAIIAVVVITLVSFDLTFNGDNDKKIEQEQSTVIVGELKNVEVVAIDTVETQYHNKDYLVTLKKENGELTILKGFSDAVYSIFEIGDVADIQYTETNHIKHVRVH